MLLSCWFLNYSDIIMDNEKLVLCISVFFISLFVSCSSGAVHFTASNNDCGVRDFDMERFQLSRHFRFPWPVNVTLSLSLPLSPCSSSSSSSMIDL